MGLDVDRGIAAAPELDLIDASRLTSLEPPEVMGLINRAISQGIYIDR